MTQPQLIEIAPPLAGLIEELKSWQHPLSSAELKSVVVKHPIARSDLGEFVQFQEEGYCHRPIAEEQDFEIGCISWRPGQSSPIHNHQGSVCCVRVVDGVLTNTDYRLDAPGKLRPSRIIQLTEGDLLLRNDRQIHRVSNEDPRDRDLISMHVYSPPLRALEERICGRHLWQSG